MSIARTDFHLGNALQRLMKAAKALARKKEGLVVDSFIDPRLPEYVIADGLYFRQILLHLLSASIKSSHSGYVMLKAVLVSQDTENVIISVIIEDSGEGMPKEELQKLFGHPKKGSRKKQSFVMELVEAKGGTLTVVSKPGEGSEFIFTNTYRKSSKTAKVAIGTETGAPLAHEAAPPVEAQRILVAEDNQITQYLIRQILSKKGYEVELASSGEEALKFLGSKSFSLVLMDTNLPDMNGYSVVRNLRTDKKSLNHGVPVISISAVLNDDDRAEALNAGMDAILAKPFEPQKLIDLIVYLLSSR